MDVMNEKTLEARSETKWPSVNREVAPLVDAMIRDAQALRVNVSQGQLGETLHRLRRARRWRVGSRPPHRRDLPRRPRARVARGHRSLLLLAVHGDRAYEPAGACLPRLAICRLEPLGRTRRARNTMCWGRARRARLAPRKSCSTSSAIATTPTAPVSCSRPTAPLRPLSSSRSPRPARSRPKPSPSSMRRRRASPARCRSPRAASKSRCISRMSCISRLHHIVDGMATAPLPPPAPGFVAAMGRTNDAIIYGGRVQLLRLRTRRRPRRGWPISCRASSQRTTAEPFADIFAAVKGDFYAIDRMLFSPAKVTVTALESGESFEGGHIDTAILSRSFSS